MTLSEIIDRILTSLDKSDLQSVEQASEQIRSLILNTEMPNEIAGEILKSYKKLTVERSHNMWVSVLGSKQSLQKLSDSEILKLSELILKRVKIL